MPTLHDFSAHTLSGQKQGLDQFQGQVVLVVNTASECGLTPQYAGLQALQRLYGQRGFSVLGFPCNQFGGQEPGGAAEIAAFCEKNYGVSFPMFEKIEVNGPGTHPLYAWLKQASAGAAGPEDIEWNFAKFLIDADGQVLRRYAPKTRPEDIAADIEAVLG